MNKVNCPFCTHDECEKSVGQIPLFDEFLFALMYLTDLRNPKKPDTMAIKHWRQRARDMFALIVAKAVRQEIEKINLRIVVGAEEEKL